MKTYTAEIKEGTRITIKTVAATDQDDAIHRINRGDGQLVTSYDLPPPRTVAVREITAPDFDPCYYLAMENIRKGDLVRIEADRTIRSTCTGRAPA